MPRYLPLIFLFRDSQHPSFIRDVSSQRRRLQMSNNYVYLFIWQARCQDDSILSLGDLITETKTSICLKSADLLSMDTPPKGDELYTLRKVSLFTYFRAETIPPRNDKGPQTRSSRLPCRFQFSSLMWFSSRNINIFLRGRLNPRFT